MEIVCTCMWHKIIEQKNNIGEYLAIIIILEIDIYIEVGSAKQPDE